MAKFVRGDVVVVPFPFSDLNRVGWAQTGFSSTHAVLNPRGHK